MFKSYTIFSKVLYFMEAHVYKSTEIIRGPLDEISQNEYPL